MMVSEKIKYIGVNDDTIDLFEGQYPVPHGVTYNSYVIMDEKIAVMDTVDARATEEWLKNLEEVLDGRIPDYLVISHLEPDHASNIEKIAKLYPTMVLIGNAKTFAMLPQFFELDVEDRKLVVAEGDTVELGEHSLQFFMAPMVHWPEVMVTYEQKEKVLFSADGFGKFGSYHFEEPWEFEARRYYYNIVGKYGASVQGLLKKANTLDIQTICPLHGPVLTENLGYYIDLYQKWSTYTAEVDGVFIAYTSMHGNTKEAALTLVKMLRENGMNGMAVDLNRTEVSICLANAFMHSKMVVCSPTYDGGICPAMEDFLNHLKAKTYQNRKVGLVENGSWGPIAAKKMKELLDPMKNVETCETVVTIKSKMKEENLLQMKQLIEELK